MFSWRQPTAAQLDALIARQQRRDFSYSAVGATQTVAPVGFRRDHNRFLLGRGEQAYQQAITALRNWEQFNVGWGYAHATTTPIAVGSTVAVVFRALGVWCANTARIVYVIEEHNRFGFAYGTLPEHVESGEERFVIEQLDDGSVYYDLSAFSRVRHPLAKLGYPYVRHLQQQFPRASAAALRACVTV